MDVVKDDVIMLVQKELGAANEKFPLFRSNHEGYAVIKEEVEEAREVMEEIEYHLAYAWTYIKDNNNTGSITCTKKLRKVAIDAAVELIQVAAMAQKYLDSQTEDF